MLFLFGCTYFTWLCSICLGGGNVWHINSMCTDLLRYFFIVDDELLIFYFLKLFSLTLTHSLYAQKSYYSGISGCRCRFFLPIFDIQNSSLLPFLLLILFKFNRSFLFAGVFICLHRILSILYSLYYVRCFVRMQFLFITSCNNEQICKFNFFHFVSLFA